MFCSYLSYITDEELQALATAYPDDVTQVSGLLACERHYVYFLQGSPFNTGTANAKTFVPKFDNGLTLHFNNFPARNTNALPLYKATCSSKPHVGSSLR